jgi:hypothetical protein
MEAVLNWISCFFVPPGNDIALRQRDCISARHRLPQVRAFTECAVTGRRAPPSETIFELGLNTRSGSACRVAFWHTSTGCSQSGERENERRLRFPDRRSRIRPFRLSEVRHRLGGIPSFQTGSYLSCGPRGSEPIHNRPHTRLPAMPLRRLQSISRRSIRVPAISSPAYVFSRSCSHYAAFDDKEAKASHQIGTCEETCSKLLPFSVILTSGGTPNG